MSTVRTLRTPVCIIGAGPSGLLLSRLLKLNGIDSLVLERRSRAYVEKRVRAGLLEEGTVRTLRAAGAADRLDREGLVHEGFEWRLDGEHHRMPFTELSGAAVWMYGQQEVVKDLIAVREDEPGLHFGVEDVSVDAVTGDGALLHCTLDGRPTEIACEFLAGCDGFHGVSRRAIPAGKLTGHSRTYPFSWLGVLAAAPPMSPELVYAVSEHGFALSSMRSHTVSRLYLQVPPGERAADRSDEAIWRELDFRLTGGTGALPTGDILERVLVPLRGFVAEPVQYRRLFLVGDAAHIVPPSAAKGLNLAVADARLLAEALSSWYGQGRRADLDAYAGTALRRAWLGQEFSEAMTSLLHEAPDEEPYSRRLRRARFAHLLSSEAEARNFAEQYTGVARR
ncbi:4-hydroxybenzoate 3-monooxygenase [Streptomyces albus]|uniref:4-hydroxybenzoate 3-monooxygenase n=1 Tax=Streptomyces albus (strain ATCC 21838 / DSM 41398 / FERM P-419 / JCM 4703 / NBRC 107858) TaxID=1081613 RepID=A0A0B5EGK3_STRA4|nr:4-hydroxybenzoate 3-monooxygenase [Streptomyces albus]AOU75583.1 4-hydroxybenzoate 3-monooxygenase [Streptomyces albus]AYN31388.1 4-hydroxybenzoate 3-monooxygenase [Streptomyces albus]